MCKLSQVLSTLIESKMAMCGYGHGDIIKSLSGQTYRNPTYLLVFEYIVSCQNTVIWTNMGRYRFMGGYGSLAGDV